MLKKVGFGLSRDYGEALPQVTNGGPKDGSAVPIIALLLGCLRNHRKPLRVIGAIVLVGLAFYDAYLIAPPFGPRTLVATALALIAIGGLLAGLMLSDLLAFVVARRRPADVH